MMSLFKSYWFGVNLMLGDLENDRNISLLTMRHFGKSETKPSEFRLKVDNIISYNCGDR